MIPAVIFTILSGLAVLALIEYNEPEGGRARWVVKVREWVDRRK